MAVFALVWLGLTISFTWNPLALPLGLIAAGNACAAWIGFERYGNLMVAIAALFSVLDLVLCIAYGGLLYFTSLDWSGLPISH